MLIKKHFILMGVGSIFTILAFVLINLAFQVPLAISSVNWNDAVVMLHGVI